MSNYVAIILLTGNFMVWENAHDIMLSEKKKRVKNHAYILWYQLHFNKCTFLYLRFFYVRQTSQKTKAQTS